MRSVGQWTEEEVGLMKEVDCTVPWPSITPTTDMCAGSTRVGLRVSADSLLGWQFS